MSSNEVDYYLLLEVNSSASATEIKKAFHRLAFIHHPDRNINDAGANERFRKINEAYQVLADVTKRNRYDQQRENFFYIQSCNTNSLFSFCFSVLIPALRKR